MQRNLLLKTAHTALVIARFLWVLLIALFIVATLGAIVNPDFAKAISLQDYGFLFSSGPDRSGPFSLNEALKQNLILISALFFFSLVKGIVVFLIFSELIKVVQSIKSLQTFTANNIRAFKNIGIYLLIIFVLNIFALSPGEEAYRFSLSIKFYPLIGSLFAFVMAEIFKEGNRLREENELTV